jgi:hypothetical protein
MTSIKNAEEYSEFLVERRLELFIEDSEIFDDITVMPTYYYYHLLHWAKQAMELHMNTNTYEHKSNAEIIHSLKTLLEQEKEHVDTMYADDE